MINNEEQIRAAEAKIQELEALLAQMKSGVEAMKQEPSVQEPVQPQPVYEEPVQPQPVCQQPVQSQPVQQPTRKSGQVSDKSIEGRFGTVVMPIIASALIFIGIVLFASLVYPLLTDTVKLTCLYVFGAILLIAGLIGIRKQHHPFFMALAACGSGVILITIFLHNAYFEMIGMIMTYVLLLVWTIGQFFLARFKSNLFLIIGRLGILVSVIFGVIRLMDMVSAEAGTSGMILAGFYAFISLVFYFADRKKSTGIQIFSMIMDYICMIILLPTVFFAVDEDNFAVYARIIFAVLGLIYVFTELILTYRRLGTFRGVNLGNVTGLLSTFVFMYYSWFIVRIAVRMLDWKNEITGGVMLVVLLTLILIWELRKRKDAFRGIVICTAYFFMLFAYADLPFMPDAIGVVVFVLPLFIAGYLMDSHIYKSLGIITLFIYTIGVADSMVDYPAAYWLSILVCTVIWYGLQIVLKEQYRQVYKVFSVAYFEAILAALCIRIDSGEWLNVRAITLFLSLLLITAVVLYLTHAFQKHPVTKAPEKGVFLYNYITMNIGLALAMLRMALADFEFESVHWYVVLMLITGVAVSVDIPWISRSVKQKPLANAIVALKINLYIFAILTMFDITGPLLSTILLLMAVVFIIIGFVGKRSFFRIYGLVLTLVCICKLLLADIHYEGLLARAVAFMACGILCFVISLIYMIADRRMRRAAMQAQAPAQQAPVQDMQMQAQTMYQTSAQQVPVQTQTVYQQPEQQNPTQQG